MIYKIDVVTTNDLIQLGMVVLQAVVASIMVYTWLQDKKLQKTDEYARKNMSMDKDIKESMKKLANADGEINDLFELSIDELQHDYLREDVYDVISSLNAICYYYKKTNRDISQSKDFWIPRFRFYANKKLFKTAFLKYKNLNYEKFMYKIFHQNESATYKAPIKLTPLSEVKTKIDINKHKQEKPIKKVLEGPEKSQDFTDRLKKRLGQNDG